MDLEELGRAEREERTLLRDRIRLLEGEKLALTRSSCDLRNQLEASIESQASLRKSLSATQANEQSLSSLNILLESRLRTAQSELSSYQQELKTANDFKTSLETEVRTCKEEIMRLKGKLVDAELRETQVAVEMRTVRDTAERNTAEIEEKREEISMKCQRLVSEFRDSERLLQGEIERIRAELAGKTKENDQNLGLIADLTTRYDDLAAKMTLSNQENSEIISKLTENLSQKDQEIVDLKEKSGVLPLLNFPTESRDRVAFLTDKLTDLQVKYNRATAKSDTFERQLRLLMQEIEQKAPLWTQQKRNYEELCEAYSTLKAEVEVQRQEAGLTEEMEKWEEKYREEREENEKMRQEIATLSTQIRTLLLEVHRLRYGGEEFQASQGTFRSISELQQENQRLNEELSAGVRVRQGRNEELLEKASLELIAQRRTIEELTRQLQVSEELLQQGYVPSTRLSQLTVELKDRENQLKLQVSNLQSDLSYSKSTITRLEHTLEDRENELITTRADLRSVKKSLLESQTRVSQLTSELMVSQSSEKRLQESASSTRLDTKTAKDRYTNLEFEYSMLKEQYQISAVSCTSLQERMQEMEKRHREEMEGMIAERGTIYGEWRKREEELRDTKKKWRDEVAKLKADLENWKAEVSYAQAAWQLEDNPTVVQYRLQISELKVAYNDLQDTHARLLRLYEDLSSEHTLALAEIQRLSDKYQLHRLMEMLEMTREDLHMRTAMYYETLDRAKVAEEEVKRLTLALKEAEDRVRELEDSLAREKNLFLQETTHTSQLQTALMAYIAKVTSLESDINHLTTERDHLISEMALKQKEWHEAQSISSGNFQYIREFQAQISNLKREKVDLEVKYKEKVDLIERNNAKFAEEKGNLEGFYRGELRKLETELETVRTENGRLREEGRGLDTGTRKVLGRLVELQHRLLQVKP